MQQQGRTTGAPNIPQRQFVSECSKHLPPAAFHTRSQRLSGHKHEHGSQRIASHVTASSLRKVLRRRS
jgi:hypothetical protein